MKDDLNKTLKEITFALGHDYRYDPEEPARETLKAGPNDWNKIKNDPKAFGQCFDFRILDGDVFMPTSRAAQEWIRSKISEDQHWFSSLDGYFGVAVTDLSTILKRAAKDGLINEADYVENMNEEAANQAVQWEE